SPPFPYTTLFRSVSRNDIASVGIVWIGPAMGDSVAGKLARVGVARNSGDPSGYLGSPVAINRASSGLALCPRQPLQLAQTEASFRGDRPTLTPCSSGHPPYWLPVSYLMKTLRPLTLPTD